MDEEWFKFKKMFDEFWQNEFPKEYDGIIESVFYVGAATSAAIIFKEGKDPRELALEAMEHLGTMSGGHDPYQPSEN